ncbi:MAG: DUF3368 domain-containing protein [candidate division KSB1 bacterium]
MIVVSNTSPIINLAAVGELELLEKLYQKLLIPHAVYHEIVITGAGQPGAFEVQTFAWIEARAVIDKTLITALRSELDPGESEAIALAIETKANWLLLDERRGREVAARFGLKFVGLLGVLLEAKKKGLLAQVKPVLNALESKAAFRMKRELKARVLEAAGE